MRESGANVSGVLWAVGVSYELLVVFGHNSVIYIIYGTAVMFETSERAVAGSIPFETFQNLNIFVVPRPPPHVGKVLWVVAETFSLITDIVINFTNCSWNGPETLNRWSVKKNYVKFLHCFSETFLWGSLKILISLLLEIEISSLICESIHSLLAIVLLKCAGKNNRRL